MESAGGWVAAEKGFYGKVKVKEVKIVDLKDHTYFATLFLILNKGLIEVDK
jgi:bifunctional DNase/RNase